MLVFLMGGYATEHEITYLLRFILAALVQMPKSLEVFDILSDTFTPNGQRASHALQLMHSLAW